MWYSLVMKATCLVFSPVNVNIPICLTMWLQSPGVPAKQDEDKNIEIKIPAKGME